MITRLLALAALVALLLGPSALADDKQPPPKLDGPLALVMNFPYQVWQDTPSKIHVVLYRADFTPAAGAEVRVNGKVVGKADADGTLIFPMTPGARKRHVLTARLTAGGKHYGVTQHFACRSRTVSFRREQLYVYTDRGVYNPGQTVRVRLIAWELKGEYRPLPKAEIELQLRQRRGRRMLAGEKLTTGPLGVATTSLRLPANADEGDYELVVLRGTAREVATLRVERFVAPVITITQDLPRHLSTKQKRWGGTARLRYASGGAVQAPKLTLAVVSRGRERFTRPCPPIADTPGAFKVELTGADLDRVRKLLPPERPFKLRLRATDGLGHSDKVDVDVRYAARPYRAILEPDKDAYVPGETVELLAKVTDLDGVGAPELPVTLTVTLDPKTTKTLEAKTDARGVARFRFVAGKTTIRTALGSPRVKGALVRRNLAVRQAKPASSKLAGGPKLEGRPAKIEIVFDKGYVPAERVMHLDLTDVSGGLVLAQKLPFVQEKDRWIARGDVVAPTWGTMLCNLYCVARKAGEKTSSIQTVGFVTEGQRITFHPDKALKIRVSGVKPRHAPGERARFTVTVEGADGEAVIGASLVDAGVLAMKDPLRIPPDRFFYNPARKVLSTGGAGVLTWPVVVRNWGAPHHDIAYRDWGWKAPGAWVGASKRRKDAGGKAPAKPGQGGANGGDAESEPEESKTEGDKDMPKVQDPVDSEQPAEDHNENSDGDTGKKAAAGAAFADAPMRRRGGAAAQRPRIVIRTRFPETSLWAPRLMTSGGTARIDVALPDAITTQTLTLVAHDKAGRIAVHRVPVAVRQALFVRSGLPATMTLGDTVRVGAYVRNLTETAVDAKVSLSRLAGGLEVLGEATVSLSIPAGRSGLAEWTVRATGCGPARFAVALDSAALRDREERGLTVRPAGAPVVTLARGGATGGKTWSTKVTVDASATHRSARLSVSLPTVVPLLQGVEAMARYPHGCSEQTATAALLNVAALEVVRRSAPGRAARYQQNLVAAAARLSSMQEKDGGWSWFRDANGRQRGPRVYLTAYALRALVAIRALDLPVDDKALTGGMRYLLSRRQGGVWQTREAYFWAPVDGEGDRVVSAEVSAVLLETAAAITAKQRVPFARALDELTAWSRKALAERSPRPLVIAHCCAALHARAAATRDVKARKALEAELAGAIDHLLSLKRGAHWEPSWTHAYGGQVELNARILALLARTDKARHDAYLREGMTYLLATREAWGGWHSTVATATAVRALARLGAGRERESGPTKIAVAVDGKVVATADIDPDDPFLSAARLAAIDLTAALTPGDHEITVTYDGALTARTWLELKQYGLKAPAGTGPTIARKTPARVARGVPFAVDLTLTAPKAGLDLAVVVERLPAGVTVDRASLLALRKSGAISGFKRDGDTLYLYVGKLEGTRTIQYRATAHHAGTLKHAGARVEAMYDAAIHGSTVGAAMAVE